MRSACRLCGQEVLPGTLRVREMMFGTREPFIYEECGTCGSLQLQSIPEDLSRYYPTDYHVYRSPPHPTWRRRLKLRATRYRNALLVRGGSIGVRVLQAAPVIGFSARVHPLAPLSGRLSSHRARIADVGGARGDLLTELRDIGFTDLTCIDPFFSGVFPSPGIHFIRQHLETVEAKFDVIMYHHSLEHVEDVPGELAAIRRHLAPQGFALLRLPVVPNAAFDRYREHWVQLDPPRHLHIPSRRGLEVAAGRAGLVIEDAGDDSWEFQFWASELYLRDIGLYEAAAAGGARTFFSSTQLRRFRREALTLNAEHRGDQAWFILRASGRTEAAHSRQALPSEAIAPR
jgi:SAM-dependent methyltransferase